MSSLSHQQNEVLEGRMQGTGSDLGTLYICILPRPLPPPVSNSELLPCNCSIQGITRKDLSSSGTAPPMSLGQPIEPPSSHSHTHAHILIPSHSHTLTSSHTHRRAVTGSPSTSSSLVMSWSGSLSSVRPPSSSPSACTLPLMSYYGNTTTSPSENQVKM